MQTEVFLSNIPTNFSRTHERCDLEGEWRCDPIKFSRISYRPLRAFLFFHRTCENHCSRPPAWNNPLHLKLQTIQGSFSFFLSFFLVVVLKTSFPPMILFHHFSFLFSNEYKRPPPTLWLPANHVTFTIGKQMMKKSPFFFFLDILFL